MNQTRRKDHQASSGRAITSRRRAERTGERAGVDEAMAGGLGWTRQGAEPRGKERTSTKRDILWESACDQTTNTCTRREADSQSIAVMGEQRLMIEERGLGWL